MKCDLVDSEGFTEVGEQANERLSDCPGPDDMNGFSLHISLFLVSEDIDFGALCRLPSCYLDTRRSAAHIAIVTAIRGAIVSRFRL